MSGQKCLICREEGPNSWWRIQRKYPNGKFKPVLEHARLGMLCGQWHHWGLGDGTTVSTNGHERFYRDLPQAFAREAEYIALLWDFRRDQAKQNIAAIAAADKGKLEELVSLFHLFRDQLLKSMADLQSTWHP